MDFSLLADNFYRISHNALYYYCDCDCDCDCYYGTYGYTIHICICVRIHCNYFISIRKLNIQWENVRWEFGRCIRNAARFRINCSSVRAPCAREIRLIWVHRQTDWHAKHNTSTLKSKLKFEKCEIRVRKLIFTLFWTIINDSNECEKYGCLCVCI